MNRVLFEIGNLKFHAYGFFVGLGIVIGVWVSIIMAHKQGITDDTKLFKSSVLIVVLGILGSRFMGALLFGDKAELLSSPIRTLFDFKGSGGTTIVGAVMFGLLGVWLSSKLWNVPMGRFLDSATVGVPIAMGVGRFGCWSAGCCYGTLSGSFGAVFPQGANVYKYGDVRRFIQINYPTPVHPTELYHALANFLLFFIVWLILRKRRKHYGIVAAVFFVGYAVFRFVVEFFRADTSLAFWGLSKPQVAMLLFYIPVGLFIMYLSLKEKLD